MRRYPFLLLGCLAASSACVAGADLDEVDTSDDELASGFAKASTFNHGGLHHSADAAGIVVDHTRGGRPIRTYDANHQPLGQVSLEDGPGDGVIRVQTLERLEIDGKKLFRVWPGGTSHQGWIEFDDVATVKPLVEEPSARAGNGMQCGSTAGALTMTNGDAAKYVVTPKRIQPAAAGMRWKTNASTGAWFSFSGDWDMLNGAPARAPLMWSWSPTDRNGQLDPTFSGGGVLRTEIREGESFIPCKVQPIRTALREADDATGSSPSTGARTLSIYAAYGRFDTKTKPMYGWLLVAEQLAQTGTCVMHVKCDGGATKCPRLPLPPACKF